MLPAPNLDDRRFQDLVDDCKRMVQQRCPEWTDHNVSDPGVTLIETFAMLTDQLLYRLNRVPDRHYVKFLELFGVELFPPNAARTEVTFWLSAARDEVLRVAAGAQVATPRSGTAETVTFTSVADLDIVPCALGPLFSSIGETPMRDHTKEIVKGTEFFCFDNPPKPDDCLYVGLTEAVPSCAVTLRFRAEIEGIGVDPDDPPLVWEAWDGGDWVRCDLDRDETGGLNRPGDVVVHVPARHATSVLQRQRAGWLRARVVEAEQDQPAYSASPKIAHLEAFTIGGSVESVHADIVRGEVVGVAEGVPGERFALSRRPVVPSDAPFVVEVAEDGSGWTAWTGVDDWAESGPDDRHVRLDATTGEIRFGPSVRMPDGSLRSFGRTPPAGAGIRVPAYRTGGGSRGNVARGALTVLKSSLPFISVVSNRRAAAGGRDGETVENAKQRGPVSLHSEHRAVTATDFEQIASRAALELARVRCIPDPDGGVRVLLVPHATDDRGRLEIGDLVPDENVAGKVVTAIEQRRVIGTRVVVEPPEYQGITVVARLRAHPTADPAAVREAALEALFRWFNPVSGGPDGAGWPFGRPVVGGEVYAILHGVEGLGIVEDVRMFSAHPVTVKRAKDPVERLELAENQLAFSVDHQVVVR